MLIKIRYWSEYYAKPGYTDDRAIQDYMVCEHAEAISSLRGELVGIKEGYFKDDTLKVLLGPMRETRYGSYQEWAKMMLLWMAAFK